LLFNLPLFDSTQLNLTTQSEPFHHLVITLDVRALEVIEQASALRDHLEQSAPRVVVLLVCFEMLCQLTDALA
jgi:hypothetical protein